MSVLFITNRAIRHQDGYLTRVKLVISLIRASYPSDEIIIACPDGHNNVFEDIQPVTLMNFSCPHMTGEMIFHGRSVTKQIVAGFATLPRPRLIVAENLFAGFVGVLVAKKLGAPLVLDYHGVVPYEVALNRPRPLNKMLLWGGLGLERWIIRRTALTVVVSENFARYVREQVENSPPVAVLPMLCPDRFLEPATMVESLPTDKIIFNYAGSTYGWQLIEPMLDYYAKIEQDNFHLLILTGDKDKFEHFIRARGIKNYTVTSVKHQEVPRWLAACDYGFALRAPDIINTVSSPTKVMEYLACGARPIMTEFVGDYPKKLQDSGMGLVIPFEDVIHKRPSTIKYKKKTPQDVDDMRRFTIGMIDSYRKDITKTLTSI